MMTGCCSMFGMMFGLTFMAIPLVAVAAIVYLLTKQPDPDMADNRGFAK